MTVLPVIQTIRDVAEYQLCTGCGVCGYLAPESVRMVDVPEHGRRPLVSDEADVGAREAFKACPGIALNHDFDEHDPALIQELSAAWGPVLEVEEGFACDPEIRFAGSSGGAASALALYCIERGGMHGVLHIAARADVPYLNHTVLSRRREELLAATGSRYAPASPCDGLQQVEESPAPCVFIGKPCDVAGAQKAAALRPALADKLGLTIAIFCAGTPSTRGTLELLKQMGIDEPAELVSLRYRGNGWPGMATAVLRTPDGLTTREMTYAQSWGDVLQKHRQWRCHLCVDHTGEFADVAVGDPWYRTIPPGEPGRSLLIVRTEKGRRLVRDAIAAGYLQLEPAKPEIVEASQPGFPSVRGSVWGRMLTCRVLGIPTPRYRRLPMFRFWWSTLSLKQKLQSIYGTVKRIHRRKLWRRVKCVPFEPMARTSETACQHA